MKHKIEPIIITPFNAETFGDIQKHVREIRRLFDWKGIGYHDEKAEVENKFNRWYWHNAPLMVSLHHDAAFLKLVSDICGQKLKPTYNFLSMYGPEGVCPLHTDRPQCQFTVDLCVDQDSTWPIYVDDKPYLLEPGQALIYSGTGQPHYRKPMAEDSKAKFCNLVFFHFAPTNWIGSLS